jgi:hypothetical protein
MTRQEIKSVRDAVGRWRRKHRTAAAREAAYLAAIPEQVAASMAFEGEPVDLQMLKSHLQTILDRTAPPGTSTR